MNSQTNPEKFIIFSSTRPAYEEQNTSQLDKISYLYKDNQKINDEVSEKVNFLLEENKKLNSIIFDLNEKNHNIQNNLLQKDVLIGEKNKEIHYLNNKITFVENELATRFSDYEQKFLHLKQVNSNSGNMESRLQELNEKIFEMTKDNQDSYNTILKANEEKNALQNQISDLTIRFNEKIEIISQLKGVIHDMEVTNGKYVTDISNLQNEIHVLQWAKKSYKENLENLLNENARLQNTFLEKTKKSDNSFNYLTQELSRKNFTLAEYEDFVKTANEKIKFLEDEKGKLTLEYALENLRNEEKIKEDNDKIKEIASTAEIVENMNNLLSEKIDENNQLKFLIENLKNEVITKEEEKNRKSALIEKLQKGLEKLLSHVDSLNLIIYNQKGKIATMNDSLRVISYVSEEIKHFRAFLLGETESDFDFELKKENYHETFSEFRMIVRDSKDKISVLKEKLFTMVIINENLVKILESQPIFSEDEDKKPIEERKKYELIIEDLKKKINLILDENVKLNKAFENIDRTRIFKSWTEGREKIESFGLHNELAKAKRNILLLLKNNKDLLEKFKGKTETSFKNMAFDKPLINTRVNSDRVHMFEGENKEKYVFQINSLKKQNDILKEMNKNRGMVIDNLLKKLKNQKI